MSMHIVASVLERIWSVFGAYSHLRPPLNINITNSVNRVDSVASVARVNSV